MNNLETVRHSAWYIREKLGIIQAGTVGLVLGSGLGPVREAIKNHVDVQYADIPNFPRSTVQGHDGFLRSGTLAGRPILALCGRVHLYEGHTAAQATLPLRTLCELGLGRVILTNAAGALNPQFDVGSLMLITDHINLSGQSPLTGVNHEEWGPRFPDMSQVWCPALREVARAAALKIGLGVERGVLIQVPGPNLETPAETRAYRQMGADAIGMSTVIEAIAAHHMGMRLLGISCLTNKNLPDCMAQTSHEEVLASADTAAADLARLIEMIILSLPPDAPKTVGA